MEISETSRKNFEAISALVNSTAFDPKQVADLLSKDHRYLQSEFFKLCYEYIRKLAAAKKLYRFDERNRWACETAEKMLAGLGPDYALLESEIEERKKFI